MIHPYIGQIYSVLCAIIWAFAVILFKKSGETVHPIALNLFKNFVAIILFYFTILLFGQSLFRAAPAKEYLIFIISGILGMAVADTFYFMCLNRIGAGLLAIVASLHSPFIISLSLIFLKEKISLVQVFGVISIVTAVLLTMQIKKTEHHTRRDILTGIIWGVISIAFNAIGVILIKPYLTDVPLLWAVEIRLIAGFISLLIITLFLNNRKSILNSLKNSKGLGYSIGATLVGTYLALLIWLAGMKYTYASIASALNQTSNVFVFLFAALILKEKITILKIISIVLAGFGIFLVFFG